MKRWLSLLLILCLCHVSALSEALTDVPDEALADPVEAAVEEADFSLGDDAAAPEEEVYLPEPELPASDKDCYLKIPDVYDIKNIVSASERVYPGPLLWPLPGRTPPTRWHSHVGWRDAARIHRGQDGDWASWLHHGVDISGVTTSQLVVAAASGMAYAGEQNGNGLYVVIDHGNGFYTKSQHLSRFAGEIFKGCRAVPVEAGDPIGYVGNTGGDYPVHFHFEIAWSPDGAGSDDETYHNETHNRWLYAYSFPQQKVVKMRWPYRWELCSAEYQTFVTDKSALEDATEETIEETTEENDEIPEG